MKDMANDFYYCGFIIHKIVDLRLIITYFGTLRMRQGPLARIWIHIIAGLSTRLECNIWCKKGKPPFFYISLASGGYCPPDPLREM